MGQYFQVNGDYNIKTKAGGTIVLDSGPSGKVNITGSLIVAGDFTSVQSTNLEINDRIVVLNKGEDTGSAGVTLVYSGIEINRAAAPNAAMVWNESNPGFSTTDPGGSGYWMIATGTDDNSATPANYSFDDSNLKLRRILTDATTDSGDLTLIGTGTGVVKVTGTTNYRLQVTDPDDIPNKDYVDYSIQNNPTFQINKDDTRVLITDKDVTPNTSGTGGSLNYFTATTGYSTAGESAVSVLVDGVLTSQFFANRSLIQKLEFAGAEITNNDTNTNISIRTNGTGKLQTNYAIQMEHPGVTPASVSGSHVIYAGNEGTGNSGLYFATVNTRDEFISRNRALVFSMIF